MMKKALFITFEGIDGCGKSTAAQNAAAYLRAKGCEVLLTLEPGGSEWGRNMRRELLENDYALDPRTETLLFAADRAEHMARVILPALKRGCYVICDRFCDSTIAYQGGGRGMDKQMLASLNAFAAFGREPDITFFLSLPLEQAFVRRGRASDRMEREENDFHRRVAAAYEEQAAQNPQRICRIDASQDIESVRESIERQLDSLLCAEEK